MARRNIDSLVLDPSNARKHDRKNLSAIKASLEKFGQQKPIVVTKSGTVLAGNGTLVAAKALGWKEIDVVVTELEGTDATAYALADNKTAELAAWDDEILGRSLKALKESGFDVTSIGFELGDISRDPGASDPDDVPPLPAEPWVKSGDLFELGDHRLLCGDSTSLRDVERLMNGEKADMVFTDPPYGMNLDTDFSSMQQNNKSKSGWSADRAESKNYRLVVGDKDYFDPAICESLADEVLLFGADYYSKNLSSQGSWFVWDKRSSAEWGKKIENMFGSEFELVWSKKKHKRLIARVPWGGIFGNEHEDSRIRIHPTQKPIKLAEWFFSELNPGPKIVDLFLGSGTTLIACEKTGRKCYGMEIDPLYCQVILERWSKFSGKSWVKL